MDFVSDQLFDGRRFRALTLVDNYSRECLEIEVGQNLKRIDVVAVMKRLKAMRDVVPKRIQVNNGSEFISKVLEKWAYDNQVTLDFSRPGNQRIIRSSNRSTAAFAMSAERQLVPFARGCERRKSSCLRKSIMASDHIVPCRG